MSGEKAEMTPSDRANKRANGQLQPFWQHPRAV
jgi:hypothetical protein